MPNRMWINLKFHTLGGKAKWYNHTKNSLAVPFKFKYMLISNPTCQYLSPEK
jgi:hypothetical protein